MGGPKAEEEHNAADEASALAASSGMELFEYLNALLDQVEEAQGSIDLELRGKIEELQTETRVVPETSEGTIERQLDEISEKMKSLESKIAELADDPEASGLLASTAELWMPVITATAEERRRNASR